MPKGVQLPHLVGNVDFVPTWLELAGGVQKGGFLLCPRLILLWGMRYALRMHQSFTCTCWREILPVASGETFSYCLPPSSPSLACVPSDGGAPMLLQGWRTRTAPSGMGSP